MDFAELIAAAARPPSIEERKQLALLAIEMMGQAVEAGDMAAAEMYLADAEIHLHAIMEMI